MLFLLLLPPLQLLHQHMSLHSTEERSRSSALSPHRRGGADRTESRRHKCKGSLCLRIPEQAADESDCGALALSHQRTRKDGELTGDRVEDTEADRRHLRKTRSLESTCPPLMSLMVVTKGTEVLSVITLRSTRK